MAGYVGIGLLMFLILFLGLFLKCIYVYKKQLIYIYIHVCVGCFLVAFMIGNIQGQHHHLLFGNKLVV